MADRNRNTALLVGTVVALIVLWMRYPLLDDTDSYAHFADDMAGHRARNVVSNAGFLLAGLAGVYCTMRRRAQLGDDYAAALMLFGFITLTACGSAWFHSRPLVGESLNRSALFLDRMPMTIALGAMLALVLRDRVLHRHHPLTLPLLIAIGAATVVYWRVCGRMLPYAYFQAYAAAGTLLMISTLRPSYTEAGYVAAGVFLFGTAKVFEGLDRQVFDAVKIGGHPVKHAIGAIAALMILLWLIKRRPVPTPPAPPRPRP